MYFNDSAAEAKSAVDDVLALWSDLLARCPQDQVCHLLASGSSYCLIDTGRSVFGRRCCLAWCSAGWMGAAMACEARRRCRVDVPFVYLTICCRASF